MFECEQFISVGGSLHLSLAWPLLIDWKIEHCLFQRDISRHITLKRQSASSQLGDMARVTFEAMTLSVCTLISLCYADQGVKCPLYLTVEKRQSQQAVQLFSYIFTQQSLGLKNWTKTTIRNIHFYEPRESCNKPIDLCWLILNILTNEGRVCSYPKKKKILTSA